MNKPLTSEEQQAALGNVQHKPMQIDLLTGELETKKPKRGNGSHIQLKPIGIEKPVEPGMANYAGEGPPGKYCQDCRNFGEIALLRPDGDETVERRQGGCVLYASRMGHAGPLTSKTIALNGACREFVDGATKVHRFIIDNQGVVHRVTEWPKKNLHLWAIEKREGGE